MGEFSLQEQGGVVLKNMIYIHKSPLLSEFNAFSLFTAFGNNKNIFSGDCMSSWSFFW